MAEMNNKAQQNINYLYRNHFNLIEPKWLFFFFISVGYKKPCHTRHDHHDLDRLSLGNGMANKTFVVPIDSLLGQIEITF